MRPLEAVIETAVPDEAGDTTSVTSAVERKKSTAILQNVDHLPTIGENEVFDEAEEGEDDEDLEQVSSNNNSPVKSYQQIHRNMSLNMSATQVNNLISI